MEETTGRACQGGSRLLHLVLRDLLAQKPVLSTTAAPAPLPAQILGKTEYEMGTHPAESADWLNVLLAQMLQGYRDDMLSDGGEDGARLKIEQWLNPAGGKLSWLVRAESCLHAAELTAVGPDRGDWSVAGHIVSSAVQCADTASRWTGPDRESPSSVPCHVLKYRKRAELDLDYYDSVSLSLQTSVLINFPRPRFAVLPVALGVELVSLGGTVSPFRGYRWTSLTGSAQFTTTRSARREAARPRLPLARFPPQPQNDEPTRQSCEAAGWVLLVLQREEEC